MGDPPGGDLKIIFRELVADREGEGVKLRPMSRGWRRRRSQAALPSVMRGTEEETGHEPGEEGEEENEARKEHQGGADENHERCILCERHLKSRKGLGREGEGNESPRMGRTRGSCGTRRLGLSNVLWAWMSGSVRRVRRTRMADAAVEVDLNLLGSGDFGVDGGEGEGGVFDGGTDVQVGAGFDADRAPPWWFW